MSGRSAPNRGKKSHRRGYEIADSSRPPSSNHSSGKYGSREPPPRFLSRPRNGDGRTNSSGDDFSSGRKEGGGHRGSGGRQGTAGSPSGGGRSNNLGEWGRKLSCKGSAWNKCVLLSWTFKQMGFVA